MLMWVTIPPWHYFVLFISCSFQVTIVGTHLKGICQVGWWHV